MSASHAAIAEVGHIVQGVLLVRGAMMIAILVAVLLILYLWHLVGGQAVPRVVARPLLTAAELRFSHVLAEALPGYWINGQVAMGALLRPEQGLDKRAWWSTYGRFSQMIVDFVVVDPAGGHVVAIVELDDRSHSVARDAARDAMLQRAGYTVLRVSNRPWPTVARVRERFADLVADTVTPLRPTSRRSGR